MNKYIKKILCGGIILGSMLPLTINAASVNLGKSDDSKDALTTIPIEIVSSSESDAIQSVNLGCQTNVDAVDCSIKIEGAGLSSNISGKKTLVTYPGSEDKLFPKNTTTRLGYISLTNSSEVKYDSVNLTLTYSINNGTSKTDESITKVFIVKGKKPKSNDATLKNVVISQGSMNQTFNKDVFEYTIYNIADTINSIKFTAECNDGNCETSYEGGKSRSATTGKTSTITLNQGNNDIKITVKSESGTTSNVYTFKTIRGESTYNSANLSKLAVGIYTLEPAFVPNNYEYKITVPNKITTTKDLIEYTSLDASASVKFDDVDLKVGENIVNIVVTNALGDDTKTYKLTITRLSDDDIDVTAYLNNKVTFTNANGEEKILGFTDFELQYPDEAKKITDGTYTFDDNGKRVHDEVTTDKEEKKSNNKIVLIIILSIVGVAIIAISGILIFKKKKPKMPKKAEEVKEEKNEVVEENDDTQDETTEETEEQDTEINEEGIEEDILGEEFSKDKDATIDIDEALNDLMNTKQYDLDKQDDE